MVNRNAARHLLLVASILLCFFVYIGYRLRSPSEPEQDAVAFAPEYIQVDDAPASSSLRPQAASSGNNAPGDWVPSVPGATSSPTPPAAALPVTPPGAASGLQSGAITGLIPAPPSAESASPAQQADDAAPQFIPSFMGDSNQDEESAFPPSLVPPGESAASPGSSEIDSGSTSSAAPSRSPFLSPPDDGFEAYSQDSSAIAAADAPLMSSPPSGEPGTAASSMRPPAGGDDSAPLADTARPARSLYNEEEASPSPLDDDEFSDLADASSVSAPASRSLQPDSSFGDEYQDDEYEYDEDEGMAAEDDHPATGSESLRMYVVRAGDTLSNIAARELGSISLADNIFLLNRDVIVDPDSLVVGVKIRLPVRDGFMPDATVAPQPGPGRRPNQGIGRTHTVARGDTLSSIALDYYGTGSGWRFLYEANKTIISNPNQLSVGMELTIPPYEN